MPAFRFPKDPSDVAPYTVDFRGLISANDEIATASWTTDPNVTDLVIGVPYNANRLTTAVLEDGTAGETYTIVITVTTVNGYTFEREVTLNVEDV